VSSRHKQPSAGLRFRRALKREKPLQIAGVINAYAAIMAERVGFRALYLSGAGVANAAHGIPDLGLTTLEDVLVEVRRITRVTSLPLLVDADTGWGKVGQAVRAMIRAGAAGIHLEDQVATKRCGHRPNKALVSVEAMAGRLRAAVAARTDRSFVIMARTDAAAVEGLDAAIARARRYAEAGADMIFPEALTSRSHYRRFAEEVGLPILCNMTEFGVTPLFSRAELRRAGVSMALYPLSAFRAMNAAALRVYRAIREKGRQQSVLDMMQTRKELYEFLDYEKQERKLDRLLKGKGAR
jgi:methylisocitrate lyase